MACMKLNCIILQSRHLRFCMLALTFLLVATLSPSPFMAQGRLLTKPNEASVSRNPEKGMKVMKPVIGSRPPRCSDRCKSCGHCEAVQVPIVPIKKSLQQPESSHFQATPRIAYSRGDAISNYKPMCWKCKCGDFFFNPW